MKLLFNVSNFNEFIVNDNVIKRIVSNFEMFGIDDAASIVWILSLSRFCV